MPDTSKLNALIESFNNEQQPWTFGNAIKAAANLNTAELFLLETIWAVACAGEHWQMPNLHDCSLSAEQALTMAYPWLSSSARHQIVNAVAYEWK